MKRKSTKRKISVQEKKNAVESYREGGYSLRELGAKHNVHHSSIEKWIILYDTFGEAGLARSPHNNKHSEEIKKEAANVYLEGGHTLYEVCRQYKLRSISLLQRWIAQQKAEKINQPK